MSRGLTTDAANAVDAKIVRPAILVYLDLVGGAVRMWSGWGELSWGGDTYLGAGRFGGVSPVTETKRISANGVALSLSGIPSEVIEDALTLNRGKKAKMWRALFDESATIIADPIQTFGGRVDTSKIEDNGETSKVVVSLESRMIDLERARVRRFTDEAQKQEHPGDRGLEFVAGIQNQELPWGQPAATGAASSSVSVGTVNSSSVRRPDYLYD